ARRQRLRPRASEVTMKRGLASPCVHSALATTRRLRLQLLRVVHWNCLKRRAGLPVRRLAFSAAASSSLIAAINRSFFAKPKTKCTALAREVVMGPGKTKEWHAILPLLERRGFPSIDGLLGGRYVPAVKAYFDREWHVHGSTSIRDPHGEEKL